MPTPTAKTVRSAMRKVAKKEKAEFFPRFFKTGPGEYGEGDEFIGVMVPDARRIALKSGEISSVEWKKLMRSRIHEERLVALLILVGRFKTADARGEEAILKTYFAHKKWVNNWDLVDLTAPHITGPYFFERDRGPLFRLAKSKNLWDRRIAIVSTYFFIKRDDFEDVAKISTILLNDPEDLIHKAVGWMLREAGKRNLEFEEKFLKRHYRKMPRTMLRYAIEKFPERKRKAYLKGTIA